ncbi:MAG: VCBS repeat-containing protein, partial [Chitinophagales bacterium]
MTNPPFAAKLLTTVVLCLLLSCGDNGKTAPNTSKENTPPANQSTSNVKLFTQISSDETGVSFENKVIENDEINYFQYQYLYNGGGVGIGDFNNDGLSDLYFSVNFGQNRLYLNEGNWKFKEITQSAGINTGMNWSTGVTLVDINNDGWLDIYQSCSGWFADPKLRRNQLFINKGKIGDSNEVTFTESAAEYGIADEGYSTQATFFDYDKDGDLDFYLANHPIEFNILLKKLKQRMVELPTSSRDKLYRNDGGKFTEVGKQAGINNHAFGLGVVASDFDKDGWTDIYVTNDYAEHDYLYRNNGNGTFTDIIDKAIKHTSNTSMGVDAADFNNDGNLDIFSLDMMAEDNKRQKVNMAPMNPKLFWTFVDNGFEYQYMRNALQLNNGVVDGKLTFSEIAQMANVATTDWSWATLFADLDNDGFKDLYITNGYKRDVLNKDEQNKLKPVAKNINKTVKFTEIQSQMSATKTPNYAYQNNGDLTFKKQSAQWGLDNGEHSNGAAYADLDNDGDLDLVVNSLDSKMQLYRNESIGKANNGNQYLRIQFKGATQNSNGLGAKVELKYGSEKQFAEQSITRGFQSACEPFLHFGLGKNTEIEELTVIWSDNQMQKLQNVKTNQVLTLDHQNAKQKWLPLKLEATIFEEVAAKEVGLEFQHRENPFNDYDREVLLPHKLSQNGPGLAAGDANGDGLEDVFIGGASGFAGALFLQKAEGTFSKTSTNAFAQDKKSEDMGAVFFDADGDGDEDLYVVSGSNELSLQDAAMQDRLYTNDGKGNFSKNKTALPAMPASGSCVKAADFDADGDMDLMIGGRLVPGKYPHAPNSYLLQNEGGNFKDVTKELAPDLQNIGMVTDAIWTDYDGDKDPDLIVVGEW